MLPNNESQHSLILYQLNCDNFQPSFFTIQKPEPETTKQPDHTPLITTWLAERHIDTTTTRAGIILPISTSNPVARLPNTTLKAMRRKPISASSPALHPMKSAG